MIYLTKPSGCILGKFTVLYYNNYYIYDDMIRDSIPGKKSVFSYLPHCHWRWLQPASKPVCT